MSEDRPVRVFAPGAYAYRNKGDATLVLAFIAWIRTAFDDPDIALTSFEPIDSAHYGVPVLDMATRPLRPFKTISHRIGARIPGVRRLIPYLVYSYTTLVCVLLRRWVRLYRSSRGLAERVAPAHILRLARAIDAADLVVTIPGGFLLAPAEVDDWWLFHLPTLELVHALGKPLVLGPCSIGPFAGFHRDVAGRLLGKCERVYVREEWSRDYVLGLGVSPDRVVYCPDLAFMFCDADVRVAEDNDAYARDAEDHDAEVHDADVRDPGAGVGARAAGPNGLVGIEGGEDRPLLGISVRWHSFPDSEDPGASRRLYMKALADTADYMISHHGARVVVAPQTLEDLKAGRALYGEIANRGDVVLLEDDLSPGDLQRLYARCRILVGTRMHANILAMCVDTPVVAIAYQPKTTGIMAVMGLEEWVLPIEDVSGLLDRARDLWIHADEVRKWLPPKITALRAEAIAVAQELRADVDGSSAPPLPSSLLPPSPSRSPAPLR